MKAKVCIKGYSCGLTCINRERSCSKELTGQSIKLCSRIATIIKEETGRNLFSTTYRGDRERVKAELAAMLDVPPDHAGNIADAINNYTRTAYTAMRRDEQMGQPNEDVDLVNEYLAKAPVFSGKIYRGLALESTDWLAPGSIIEWDAMSSHSSSILEGYKFAIHGTSKTRDKKVMIEIEDNLSGVSIQDFSTFQAEKEILVPKGSRYQVLSKRVDQVDDFYGEDVKHAVEVYTVREIK